MLMRGPHLQSGVLISQSTGIQSRTSGVVASKITDHAARRSWYPPLVAGLPGHATQVTTFDASVETYPADTVCDMEASAYFACATRFSTAELVQCYKVVSDNGSTGTAAVTADV